MMEAASARVLWRRSVQRHKLRYTTLLSDGDAKTFAELTKIKPYGEDIEIDKEECVNHVSKTLGSALRNIVTDCRKRGVTLGGGGGRGKGQLTQNAIRKLTIYYNRAIRGSSSVDSMKKAVMASLHHCFVQMTGLAMNSAPQEWTPGAFFKKHSPSIKCQGHTTSWSTLPSTRKSLLLT